MRKVCLLCLFVILGVADAGCAKQQSAEGVTPTTIVESTVAPTTLTATLEPTQEVTLTAIPTVTLTPTPTVTPTPTPVITFSVPVTYHPVELEAEGVTEIQCSEGEGVELDLNGDGVPEQIYTAEEGVYINGILQEHEFCWEFRYDPFNQERKQIWETYWIVDVDTADKYYNLIFSDPCASLNWEKLMYYDTELHQIARMGYTGSVFRDAEYFGDGTFIIGHKMALMYSGYYAEMKYYLNEDGGITRVDEFVPLAEPYPLELLETIKMYKDHNLECDTIIVEPQTVQALATSENWIQFRLEDGTEAWIYVEYTEERGCVVNQGKTAQELFSGFSTAG